MLRQKSGLDVREHADSHFFSQIRVLDHIFFTFLPRCQNEAASIIRKGYRSVFFMYKIFGNDTFFLFTSFCLCVILPGV